MKTLPEKFRGPALLLATLLAFGGPGLNAQVPTEGYDPFRQITAQLVKANLLVVQDVSGSMAWDRWGNDIGDSGPGREEVSVQDQSATGRLVWTETEYPSGDPEAGLVRFAQRRVSDNSAANADFWDIPGVRNPGIYTYTYSGQPFTYNYSGAQVYPTSFPVLDKDMRLVYKCRPTGTWREAGRVPWNNGTPFFYNDRFDYNSCTGPFTYTLRWDLPSRMSNVKNALGDSVYLAESYTPPEPADPANLVTRWRNDGTWNEPWASAILSGKQSTNGKWFLGYTENSIARLNNPYSYAFRVETGYDLKFTGNIYDPRGNNPTNPAATVYYYDPPRPFKAHYYTGDSDLPLLNDTDGNPVATSPSLTLANAARAGELNPRVWAIGQPRPGFGTSTLSAPRNIVGVNKTRINFGLQTFSGSTDEFPFLVPVDTYDGTNVTRLLSFFAPLRTPASTSNLSFTAPQARVPVDPAFTENVTPLGASGNTPTRYALAQAAEEIKATFYGVPSTQVASLDTSNEPDGGWQLPPDPKRTCNRPYGVILVTDGLSNHGNPGNAAEGRGDGRNWIDPCNNANPGTRCDVGTSGYDCPENWDNFAAGVADDIYTNALDPGSSLPLVRPRTWAIGISPAVGPCELSFIAYMGRTDAASPAGDAGFGGYDATDNPHLPNPSTSVAAYPVNGNAGTYDGPTGQLAYSKNTANAFNPSGGVGHGYNAFFATDADAIRNAFTTIVNATATGDYSTNAPVSGMAASQSNVVYVPSTEFPNWKGHLYAFDTRYLPTEDAYLNQAWNGGPDADDKGDAAKVLNVTPSSSRKIFTWNPSTLALVEVTDANIATLAPLGGAGFTTAVVDFIRGNDGSGVPRAWRLGPLINSAPAVVGPPQAWLQGTTINHKPFEATNSTRTALIWVGSNDGMMHAFRVSDGVEQIALIPPSLLPRQVDLYQSFLGNRKYPTGQPIDPADHVWGVANSFRFGDVWDPNIPGYRTVGFVTTGPGSEDLVAIDVTKVPAPSASPYPASPVTVLWRKDATSLPGLKQSWSIPAMAPVKADAFRLILGSGFNPGNTAANQVSGTGFTTPNAFSLDPVDGTLLSTLSLTKSGAHTPFVGSQAFADTVLFNPTSKYYQEDNIASLGLQADLNGQIWFIRSGNSQMRFESATVGINASTKVGQSQPIYYNPAASGYGQGLAGCVAYAFGSGTLYERSDAITGYNKTFAPRLFVATAQKANATSAVPASNIVAKQIVDTTNPWLLKTTATDAGTAITFGPRTQLTAPPFMLVPRSGRGSVTALFLLYDPDEGCRGNSYVAVIEFEGDASCLPTNTTFTAFDAGEGAASGFTIAGDKVLVAKSGVGEGQRAGLYEPPGIAATVGGIPEPRVKWWKELK